MVGIVTYYNYWDLWSLYHKVTFDGANRIILVNEGVTELNIKEEVYSDWKEWVAAMPDNALWPPAIRTIGGDPTVTGQFAGDIYFLQNGWKLYIDLTKVRVSGALFSDDYDSAYYDYQGNIQYPAQVSSIVNTISTGGVAGDSITPEQVWTYGTRTLTSSAAPTASEVASAVWDRSYTLHDSDGTFGHLVNYISNLEKELWVNTELASNGVGSQESPYNNINSAKDRAEEDGIRVINLIGDVTLSGNFNNFTIKGIGVPEVDFNGQSIKNSQFSQVKVKGQFTNGSSVVIRDSVLLNGAYLEGFIENCALAGNLICQDGANVFLKDCASSIPGTNRPTISMNASGTSQLSVRGYNGGLTIKDCNNASDRVTVELGGGSLTFDSSCTNGIMVARGVGKFVDQTAGATVVNETVNQEMIDDLESKVLELWRLAGLDASNIQTITDTSITVGGITITIGTPNESTTTLTRS